MDFSVILSTVLELIQNQYVIIGYLGGFVISFGVLYLLFSSLVEGNAKAIYYSVIGALVFPITLLVLISFSSGVAVSHTIKILLGKG